MNTSFRFFQMNYDFSENIFRLAKKISSLRYFLNSISVSSNTEVLCKTHKLNYR